VTINAGRLLHGEEHGALFSEDVVDLRRKSYGTMFYVVKITSAHTYALAGIGSQYVHAALNVVLEKKFVCGCGESCMALECNNTSAFVFV
jgi:hypothetical protein